MNNNSNGLGGLGDLGGLESLLGGEFDMEKFMKMLGDDNMWKQNTNSIKNYINMLHIVVN